jgi:uncharacterized protein (DUF58 family)
MNPPPLPKIPPFPAKPVRVPPTELEGLSNALLNIEELERFENLLIFAKAVVEGYFAGKHKSPNRGSAAEFADYKEYVPGDDLARLDWRVYGRTRRLYIRQFEEETDMVVYLLVDASGSMRYAGEKRTSKFHLAARIAASLAYLMLAQGDKAALATFAETITNVVPAGGTRRHLHQIVRALERVKPSRGTSLAQAISQCVGIFKRRGRLVVISDFLDDDSSSLYESLSQFVHRKFEILLLHVVDPDELHLPAHNVAKFVDMETGETIQVDPEEIRSNYEANMQQRIDAIAREADLRGIQHRIVDTRRPYLDAIEAYLGFRGKNELSR